MKILAPKGTTSASHAGEEIEFNSEGIAEVSTAVGKHLCDSFGFTVPGEKQVEKAKLPDDKFTDMSRAEVIGYLKEKGLPVVPSTDTDTLKAQARVQYSPEERAADAAKLAQAKA